MTLTVRISLVLCIVAVSGQRPPDGRPRGYGPPGHGPPHEIRQYIEECKTQTDPTNDEVHMVMRKQIPETENGQCFLACMNKKVGLFDQDNKVDLDKVKEMYGPMQRRNPEMYEKLIKIVEDCKAEEESDDDECDAARKYAECAFPKLREVFEQHHPKNKMMADMSECRTNTDVTNAEMHTIMRNEMPETRNGECFMACMNKKRGIMTEDGRINVATAKVMYEHIKQHDPETYDKIIQNFEDCKAQVIEEDDECNAAKKFAECFIPKDREIRRQHPPRNGRRQHMRNVDECMETSEASYSEAGNMIRHEMPKSKNEECFVGCINKKMGLLTEDNKIDVDKAKEMFARMKEFDPELYEKRVKVYEDCKAEEEDEDDECEAGKKFAECTIPKLQELRIY